MRVENFSVEINKILNHILQKVSNLEEEVFFLFKDPFRRRISKTVCSL